MLFVVGCCVTIKGVNSLLVEAKVDGKKSYSLVGTDESADNVAIFSVVDERFGHDDTVI